MTRRRLQIVLGLLWLLDGALQLQPFMLGTGFARQIVDVNATGQPQFVAVPLHWAADLIAAHPVAWDVPFATVQLLFVLASGIWVLAQNFGGLYTGQATDPNTAPLIALTAVALVGAHRRRSTSTAPESAPAARSTSKISISFQGTDL